VATKKVSQPAPPFKVGQAVRQVAKPFRHGTVIAARGSGPGAQITVGFAGWITTTVPAATLAAG